MYIAFCGITVSLNTILMALIGRLPVIGAYAVSFPAIMTTPVITEYGWKKTVPVYIATALLSLLIVPYKYAMLYSVTGYFALLPDACGVDKWKKRWFLFCIPAGFLSTGAIVLLAQIMGLKFIEALGNYGYMVLLVLMFLLAFMKGILYVITRDKMYVPVLQPLVKKYL